MKKTIHIQGMHCKSCEMLIKDDLEGLEGVVEVKADSSAGTVSIKYEKEPDYLLVVKFRLYSSLYLL